MPWRSPDALAMVQSLLVIALGFACDRAPNATPDEQPRARDTTAPPVPAPPEPSDAALPPKTVAPACETRRIDDLCEFLRVVTAGLASSEQGALACPGTLGRPRVTLGNRSCVAESAGTRTPIVCDLDWPGDAAASTQLAADARRVTACLPEFHATTSAESFEAKGVRVRCELLVNRTVRSYGLVCSRRNLAALGDTGAR